jgi:tripartite-type tricarboxylate transporter receptor subunit TctC
MSFVRRVLATLAVGAALAAGAASAADAYPSKPIHIVVPTAAGGTVDIMARLIGKGLAEELGQPVIVENHPSASGLVGSREVAHAEPDGYTLLAIANTFVSAPYFVPEAGYDPVKDFAPVTQTCQIPMVLVTNAKMPQHAIKALIERAKAHPGEVSYASSGVGSTGYIAAELFSREAGVKLLSVPYKGNAQAIVDVVGGQVMTMFDQVSTSAPYIRSHQLRAVAVTTRTRSALLPDVPTIAESGLPGYEDVTFNAIVAPAGTPAAIVARLHAGIVKVLSEPTLRKQMAAQGIEVKTSETPQAFGDYLRHAAVKYRGIAQAGHRPS